MQITVISLANSFLANSDGHIILYIVANESSMDLYESKNTPSVEIPSGHVGDIPHSIDVN